MDFYKSLGFLVLGSRLKRLSDYFLSEINLVYQEQGIEFDASWFPLFYLLSENEELSIGDIAKRTQVSHSAVSQLITNLKKRELVRARVSEGDGRVQLVELSESGKDLLKRIKPIWQGLSKSMEDLHWERGEIRHVLSSVTALEESFMQSSLSERVQDKLTVNDNCERYEG